MEIIEYDKVWAVHFKIDDTDISTTQDWYSGVQCSYCSKIGIFSGWHLCFHNKFELHKAVDRLSDLTNHEIHGQIYDMVCEIANKIIPCYEIILHDDCFNLIKGPDKAEDLESFFNRMREINQPIKYYRGCFEMGKKK